MDHTVLSRGTRAISVLDACSGSPPNLSSIWAICLSSNLSYPLLWVPPAVPKAKITPDSTQECLFQWQNQISGLGSLQRDQTWLSFSQQPPAPVTRFAPCSLPLCSALKPRKQNHHDFINNVEKKTNNPKQRAYMAHPIHGVQSFLQHITSLDPKSSSMHLPAYIEIHLCRPALGRNPLFRTDWGWAGQGFPPSFTDHVNYLITDTKQ